MTPHVTLFRAISSEFAKRKLKALVLVLLFIFIILCAVAAFLISVNEWWWLLAIPLSLLLAVSLLVMFIIYKSLQKIKPGMTVQQSESVSGFVDKFERLTENLQVPMPVILFKIIKDLVLKSKNPFVKEISTDSSTLHKDFIRLVKDFNKN